MADTLKQLQQQRLEAAAEHLHKTRAAAMAGLQVLQEHGSSAVAVSAHAGMQELQADGVTPATPPKAPSPPTPHQVQPEPHWHPTPLQDLDCRRCGGTVWTMKHAAGAWDPEKQVLCSSRDCCGKQHVYVYERYIKLPGELSTELS